MSLKCGRALSGSHNKQLHSIGRFSVQLLDESKSELLNNFIFFVALISTVTSVLLFFILYCNILSSSVWLHHLFHPVENNTFSLSLWMEIASQAPLHVKVTSWKLQSISAFSRAPKSGAVKRVGCSQSALLSLSPTHSSPVTFPAQ